MALDWDFVTEFVADARHLSTDGASPDMVASLDQLEASMRDALDSVGLTITDEEVVFTVLVTLSLLARNTCNCLDRGSLDAAAGSQVLALISVMTSAAAGYAPAGILW